MILSNKRGNIVFSLIQSLYWANYGLIFSFASKYLLNRDFTNTQIGICFAVCFALSAVLQPVVADMMSRRGINLHSGVICMYSALLTVAVALLVIPMGKAATAVLFTVMMLIQSSLQPLVISLHQPHILRGTAINFGIARGLGSLAYALVILAMGRLLKGLDPNVLPVSYIIVGILLVCSLLAFPTPALPMEEKRAGRSGSLLKENPRFLLYMIALFCVATGHSFHNNFLLQIMQSLGGDTTEQGIAAAIAAVCELPVMFLYVKISRKINCRTLLLAAGWFWLLRFLLMYVVTTPTAYYFTTLLQGVGYAVYVPAGVDYAASTLPKDQFLKGQALAGAAFTVGSLASSLLSGRLIDTVGVHSTILVMIFIVATGALFFTLAMVEKKKPAKQ